MGAHWGSTAGWGHWGQPLDGRAAGDTGDSPRMAGQRVALGTAPAWQGSLVAPGAAVALGIGHIPGDKAGLRLGTSWEHESRGVPGLLGPMAGQGCEQLETSPAVALLGQGLMALGG